LIFRFALEFKGAETPAGRDLDDLWHRSAGFRHVFRVITLVWGAAFLAAAAANVVIIESTSASVAKSISTTMPYVVVGIVLAWMVPYSLRAKRRGARRAAEQG